MLESKCLLGASVFWFGIWFMAKVIVNQTDRRRKSRFVYTFSDALFDSLFSRM